VTPFDEEFDEEKTDDQQPVGPCGFPEAVPVISVSPEISFRSKIYVISGLDFRRKYAKMCVISRYFRIFRLISGCD
jgi:hypothetical protein